MREKVTLVCTDCLSRNYNTMKNKTTQTERLTFKKHCPKCNAHTEHKETR